MFSDKLKARIGALALVGSVLAVTPVVASAGVVVRSSGPSAATYPVGREVADSSSITLRSGDRITVLTERGTRVLSGPGTFRVGERVTRAGNRFSRISRRDARSGRTGAVRGGPGEATVARRTNLWVVDVAATGNVCLYDLSRIRLWREELGEAQTITITDQASQASLAVPFFKEDFLRVIDPDVLPVVEGGNYTITTPASEGTEPRSVSVTFVTLAEEYDTPDALAEALITNGCMAQLEALTDILESGVSSA